MRRLFLPGGTRSAGPYELRLPIFLQPLGGALKNRSAAPAAHLKRPRRGLFAAGTYSGGRCCSNPPLWCFVEVQIKQKLQRHHNAGVLGGRGWIRTTEAEKQQIYSLSPLATREHAHILFSVIADCLYILSSEVAFVNYFFHGFSLFLSFSIFLRFTAIKALSITAKDPKTFSVLRSFWSW